MTEPTTRERIAEAVRSTWTGEITEYDAADAIEVLIVELTARLASSEQFNAQLGEVMKGLWHSPACDVFTDVTAQCNCGLSVMLEKLAASTSAAGGRRE